MLYNRNIPNLGNPKEGGLHTMNYPEIIWRLIEMLLQEKDKTNKNSQSRQEEQSDVKIQYEV